MRIFAAISVLLITSWLNGNSLSIASADPILIITAGYLLLTTLLTLLNRKNVLAGTTYSYCTIFTDTLAISLLLIFGGESTSPLCAVYYLIILHSGIKTQNHRLLTGTILSSLGFATALYLSSYWASQIYLGLGLLCGLLLTSLILYKQNEALSANNTIHRIDNENDVDDQSNLKLLIITSDRKDRHMLKSYIDSWGIDANIHNSSLRAFAELVNHAEDSNAYTTVIIDSLNFDMDPVQFAKYIRLDSSLSNTHLIHLSPEHSAKQKEQLLAAGYTTLLKTPIDKTILFDAIHTYNTKTTSGKNITHFINHYSYKSNTKQPLDILLAVGNKTERESFSATLEHNGQRVYAVENVSQTLDALHTHQFDLVILDFTMPEIEAKEIIRLYYYTYLNEDWMPFIALVDEATPEVLSQCRDAEVNAILVRPVEQNEILITVTDIASSKAKRAESIQKHWQPPHINETQIRNSGDQILNTQTLIQLEELSSSKNFLSQLTTKFNQDMEILVARLELSINNNSFTSFKDSIYALKDSSCNLGAEKLHKISLFALQINQSEFQGQATLVLSDLKDTLEKTKHALQNYAAKQDNSASELE